LVAGLARRNFRAAAHAAVVRVRRMFSASRVAMQKKPRLSPGLQYARRYPKRAWILIRITRSAGNM
jgi:hypothetical protein